MARIDDIERRLLNWARWKQRATSGALGYATPSLWRSIKDQGYREAIVPTIDCEADETDQAVSALSSELRGTVEVVYLVEKTLKWKAAYLCCSEAAVGSRIWTAHKKIQQWLCAKNEKVQAGRCVTTPTFARDRVEVSG